jgi:histone H2A
MTTEIKKHTKTTKSTIDNFNFSVYIYKVLKLIHPDNGLSGAALTAMVNLVKINISKIMKVVNQLSIRTGAKTITERELQTAITIAIPGELSKHAKSEGEKAVLKYHETKGGTKTQPIQRTIRASLAFNVARIENLMMLEASVRRKSSNAAIFLTAAIEYLTAEVLELAGNAAIDNKKIRITPRHIKLAIANDMELSKLYQDTILSGGVQHHIHQSLLPKAKESKVIKPKKKYLLTKKKVLNQKLKRNLLMYVKKEIQNLKLEKNRK